MISPSKSTKENLPPSWSSRAGVILDYNSTSSNPHTGLLVQRKSPLAEQNGPYSPYTESEPSEALMSLDISSSQFMRAMNFDNLAGIGNGNEVNGQRLTGSTKEVSGSGRYDQQSTEDQGKLLQRFQQLRQWQQQQQEMLMRQQHMQLEVLREEQQRVQAMITHQRREMQWGSPKSPSKSQVSEWSSPKKVSPHKSPVQTSSSPGKKNGGIPRALAASTLALAREQGKLSYTQKPPTRLQAMEPELQTDTESEVASVLMEEGVYPLPDTASELSESPDQRDVTTTAAITEKKYKLEQDFESDVQYESPRTGNLSENTLNKNQTGPSQMKVFEKKKEQEFDEKPIKPGLSGKTMTFEELIDQQLQEEQNKLREAEKHTGATKETKHRSFLKRGQGTARFKMSETPPKKPNIPKTDRPKSASPSKPLARKVASRSPVHHPMKLHLNPSPNKSPNPALKQIKLGQVELSETMELSFQNILKDREQNEKYEKDELEEFELLEKFAADNASFLSNPSPLVKSNWRANMGIPVKAKTITDAQSKITPVTAPEYIDSDSDLSDNDSYLDQTITETKFESGQMKDVQQSSSKIEKTTVRKISPLRPPASENESADEDKISSDVENVEEQPRGFDNNIMMRNEKEDLVQSTDSNRNNAASNESDTDSSDDDSNHTYEESEDDSEHKHLFSFGDEETWGDKSVVSTQVNIAVHSDEDHVKSSTPPPTTQLMTKLFPKLKPQKPKVTPQQQQNQEKLEAISQQPITVEGVQSKVLKDKLMELEAEIERFRKENAALTKLRQERAEGIGKLQREIDDFDKQKMEELKRIQEFKEQETKKIKHERKVYEQYKKAAKDLPDKKGREEIEMLRNQISELQEEIRRKETRWTSSTSRLRNRVEQLETENSEMKEEVKQLEKLRLETWQKNEENKRSQPNKKSIILQQKVQDVETKLIPGSNSQSDTNAYGGDSSKGRGKKAEIRVRNEGVKETKSRDIKKDGLQQDKGKAALNILKGAIYDTSLEHNEDVSLGRIGTPPVPTDKEQSEEWRTGPLRHDVVLKLTPASGNSSAMDDVAPSNLNRKFSEQLSVDSREDLPKNITRKKAVKHVPNMISIDKGDDEFEEFEHPDGKLERLYSNGAREVYFPNGTKKEISTEGESIIVSFFNGDIKQILPNQQVIYYYAEAQTTHCTYPDGVEILHFPNDQTEKTFPDGTKEITFPDHTIKYLYPNGLEESVFQDGTVIRVEKNGDKTMEFPNGQREIHTQQYKRREYPDGTVKTVYPDGKQETRYSNGRFRVKDQYGNMLVDRR